MATQPIVKGAIKVSGVPDGACFTTFADLLKSLGTYLTVEIPNQVFSNIIISSTQPGSADAGKIWWRLSNAGTFIGIYTYANNVWNQVIPTPNEIFWIYGDSANPPAGFSFAAVEELFDPVDYTHIIASAAPAGGVPPFVYFPVIYVGF